jgi:hypothetical protein
MAAAGLADCVDIRCLLAVSGVLLLAAGVLVLWLEAPRPARESDLIQTV